MGHGPGSAPKSPQQAPKSPQQACCGLLEACCGLFWAGVVDLLGLLWTVWGRCCGLLEACCGLFGASVVDFFGLLWTFWVCCGLLEACCGLFGAGVVDLFGLLWIFGVLLWTFGAAVVDCSGLLWTFLGPKKFPAGPNKSPTRTPKCPKRPSQRSTRKVHNMYETSPQQNRPSVRCKVPECTESAEIGSKCMILVPSRLPECTFSVFSTFPEKSTTSPESPQQRPQAGCQYCTFWWF